MCSGTEKKEPPKGTMFVPTNEKGQAVTTDSTSQKREATLQNKSTSKTWSNSKAQPGGTFVI